MDRIKVGDTVQTRIQVGYQRDRDMRVVAVTPVANSPDIVTCMWVSNEPLDLNQFACSAWWANKLERKPT